MSNDTKFEDLAIGGSFLATDGTLWMKIRPVQIRVNAKGGFVLPLVNAVCIDMTVDSAGNLTFVNPSDSIDRFDEETDEETILENGWLDPSLN